MLLTLTTTHKPATDMGYLLHKNPFRCQSVNLPFGKINLFYPEATQEKCTIAILMEIDPIALVRNRHHPDTSMPLAPYVNDRPYVCSSFLSVALSRVFGQTLHGKCKERPELVETKMPLTCRLSVLPCRGGETFLKRLFEPLGYIVVAEHHTLDTYFPDWGDSVYYSVELKKETTLAELFNHLYVLVPVLDNQKHYYIDKAEIDKLITCGEGWLAQHPEKQVIAQRFLKHKISFATEALARLMEINPTEEEEDRDIPNVPEEIENTLRLNEVRLGAVLSVLKAAHVESVIDLGCGEGKLLRLLLQEKQFKKIVGVEVSIRALEKASERLKLPDLPPLQKERIQLMHGSLLYRDRRFQGFGAATLIEVIEHLDADRLQAFERVVFEFAQPKIVILTTPNREYNVVWPHLGGQKLRHGDHRFEWTRAEFTEWAHRIALKYHYAVRFLPVGQEMKELGAPTQMAIFNQSSKAS